MGTPPQGQVWENFVRRSDELVMVAEGKLELELEGGKFCPELGEEVYIPKNMVHSVRNNGGTTSRWLYGYKKDPAW